MDAAAGTEWWTMIMQRLALFIWAVLAAPLAGCAGQAPDSPSGVSAAEPAIGSGGDPIAGIADEVRAALAPCWNVDPEMPPIIVMIDVAVRRDGTVAQAAVSDQDLYRTDPAFRDAADRALRAVLNPHCQPLPFPDATWPSWSELNLRFDPSPKPAGS